MKGKAVKILPRNHFVNGRQSIDGWEKYLTEGKQFYKVAENGARQPKKFTPVILYNVMAMSIEKYMMALCMYNGIMPENHTLSDLVRSVKEFLTLPGEMEKKLLHLDSIQQICSVEQNNTGKITDEDVPLILSAGSITRSFAESWLPV